MAPSWEDARTLRETTAARAAAAEGARVETEVTGLRPSNNGAQTASTDQNRSAEGRNAQTASAVDPRRTPARPTPPTDTACRGMAAAESPAARILDATRRKCDDGGGATQDLGCGVKEGAGSGPRAPAGQQVAFLARSVLKADGDVLAGSVWPNRPCSSPVVALPTYRPVIMLGEDLHRNWSTRPPSLNNDPRSGKG